jgi:hypothetical protein
VELITPSSLYVCFCVMGVAHFSLFLGGRERQTDRKTERKRRERGDSWPKVHNLWVCLLCS